MRYVFKVTNLGKKDLSVPKLYIVSAIAPLIPKAIAANIAANGEKPCLQTATHLTFLRCKILS
ncbi:MAG: hypothetical protein V7K67_20620 [Nostoc sp.]|uniref:hypothetical protein n=1 Tax=Nostoc sp. TaxID=1180 RepID=UPI002FFC5F92